MKKSKSLVENLISAKIKNPWQEIFLDQKDALRCQNSLLKLKRHLTEEIILTGSQAGSLHLLKNKQHTKIKLNDIDIVVQKYQHPVYAQMWGVKDGGGFISHLSAADLLFNCGPDSLAVLKGGKV